MGLFHIGHLIIRPISTLFVLRRLGPVYLPFTIFSLIRLIAHIGLLVGEADRLTGAAGEPLFKSIPQDKNQSLSDNRGDDQKSKGYLDPDHE